MKKEYERNTANISVRVKGTSEFGTKVEVKNMNSIRNAILMGFGLDSDAIHSPNEHYGLFNFYRGIETIPYFYKHFTDLSK